MNADEALKVCRFAKALSPAQAVDEYSPQAWALVLRNVRYCDATDALEALGGEQEWIHVSHIVKRVKRIRRQRVLDYGVLPDPPPGHDPDDTEAHRNFLAAATRRIADGEDVPRGVESSPAAIRGRDVIRELGTVGQPIDAPETAVVPAREAIAKAKTEAAAAEAAKRTQRDAHIAQQAASHAADRKAREAKAATEGDAA